MSDKILFVDDEANILSGFKRQFHKQFDLEFALSGKDGLDIIDKKGPFAVVISDMRMPKMDGIQFLKKVKETASESVRIMLTGNADIQTAVNAVNEGNIFRFLTKPCPNTILANSLDAGVKQYHLIQAEKVLLENTLTGSIKVLTEILSLVNPAAFSHTNRIKRYVIHIVKQLNLPNQWQFELAAMFSQIGCVAIPPDILDLVYTGETLPEDKQKIYSSHPLVGSMLLAHIPRLEIISKMIGSQQKPFKDYTKQKKDFKEYVVDIGSQILRAIVDLDQFMIHGHSFRSALKKLRMQKNIYNPHILEALENLEDDGLDTTNLIKQLKIKNIMPGVIAYENIKDKKGVLLVPKGQEITYAVIAKLQNFSQGVGVQEPFRVQVIS